VAFCTLDVRSRVLNVTAQKARASRASRRLLRGQDIEGSRLERNQPPPQRRRALRVALSRLLPPPSRRRPPSREGLQSSLSQNGRAQTSCASSFPSAGCSLSPTRDPEGGNRGWRAPCRPSSPASSPAGSPRLGGGRPARPQSRPLPAQLAAAGASERFGGAARRREEGEGEKKGGGAGEGGGGGGKKGGGGGGITGRGGVRS